MIAQTSSPHPTPLRDNARPLYIFTPTRSDPRAVEQLAILRDHPQEAHERQIVGVLEDATQPFAALPLDLNHRLTREDADQAATRRRFKVDPDDFTVILAGKDGGEKLRSNQPIPFDKLRDTIDAMPMRQDEMRHKN